MGGGAGFSDQYSHPSMFDPFGSMPFSVAGSLQRQFARPLTMGFGRGSPALSSFVSQGNQFTPNYMPTLTALSGTLTSGATGAYGGYQAAVDQFMKQLPGFQASAAQGTAGAQEGLGYARTAAADAFSPLQGRALYQEAARRALAPERAGAAARGMLEGGQAQAGESNLLSDLAFKALQGDREAQQQAIQGLTGAAGAVTQGAGAEAGLAGMGPEARGALFQAYPQLAQILTGAAQLPMGGLGQILQLLTGTQQPSMDLLKLILPQMGQTSRTHAASIQASAGSGG